MQATHCLDDAPIQRPPAGQGQADSKVKVDLILFFFNNLSQNCLQATHGADDAPDQDPPADQCQDDSKVKVDLMDFFS